MQNWGISNFAFCILHFEFTPLRLLYFPLRLCVKSNCNSQVFFYCIYTYKLMYKISRFWLVICTL